MNLITSGVMRAMTGAASSTALADVSMGVYRQAKSKGNDAGMGRAAGYAAGSMQDAAQENQAAQEALKQAQTEARRQEALDRQAALQDARDEARADRQQEAEAEAQAEARAERQNSEDAQADARLAPQQEATTGGKEGKPAAERAVDIPAAPQDASQAGSPQPTLERPARAEAAVARYAQTAEILSAAPEQKLSVTV